MADKGWRAWEERQEGLPLSLMAEEREQGGKPAMTKMGTLMGQGKYNCKVGLEGKGCKTWAQGWLVGLAA